MFGEREFSQGRLIRHPYFKARVFRDTRFSRHASAFARKLACRLRKSSPPSKKCSDLELRLHRVLGGGHHVARDLPHMFAGIGELAPQELRLDLHRLLKVSRMHELARMFE